MFSKLLIDILLTLSLDISAANTQTANRVEQLTDILPQLEYTKKELANVNENRYSSK